MEQPAGEGALDGVVGVGKDLGFAAGLGFGGGVGDAEVAKGEGGGVLAAVDVVGDLGVVGEGVQQCCLQGRVAEEVGLPGLEFGRGEGALKFFDGAAKGDCQAAPEFILRRQLAG